MGQRFLLHLLLLLHVSMVIGNTITQRHFLFRQKKSHENNDTWKMKIDYPYMVWHHKDHIFQLVNPDTI